MKVKLLGLINTIKEFYENSNNRILINLKKYFDLVFNLLKKFYSVDYLEKLESNLSKNNIIFYILSAF